MLDAIASVEDPELGLGIVDLGLVREVHVSAGRLSLRIGTTSAACPFGAELARQVREALSAEFQGMSVDVSVGYDPTWSPADMTAEARRKLGWM
ncbi:MAG: metal-sulfur cluster assembly factor [Polyangiaceae bacterium]|nr:metal-sulfur cluster assembly factor [Polyangiaceae bacterium]